MYFLPPLRAQCYREDNLSHAERLLEIQFYCTNQGYVSLEELIRTLKKAKRNSILKALSLLQVIFSAFLVHFSAGCCYAMVSEEYGFSKWHISSHTPKNSSSISKGLMSSYSISQANTWSQTAASRRGVGDERRLALATQHSLTSEDLSQAGFTLAAFPRCHRLSIATEAVQA